MHKLPQNANKSMDSEALFWLEMRRGRGEIMEMRDFGGDECDDTCHRLLSVYHTSSVNHKSVKTSQEETLVIFIDFSNSG